MLIPDGSAPLPSGFSVDSPFVGCVTPTVRNTHR